MLEENKYLEPIEVCLDWVKPHFPPLCYGLEPLLGMWMEGGMDGPVLQEEEPDTKPKEGRG